MDSSEGRLVYEFGDFHLDATRRSLLSKTDGRALPLTSKAFETLLYLVEHRGELLDKATLMKAIWPNTVVEENNLNQNITTVRRVLGESPDEHRFIVTVPGRGYRFVAGVKTLAAPAVGKPRLAILPFENLSPDPANAFFADGLHGEILSTIAQRVAGLEVISRTTMMSYRRDPPKPLAEVARELGASHLIEGSVRRDVNRVRLTLQLIDARTDVYLWSQNYDRTLTDALTLQSDVAGEVASQLSLELVGGPESALPRTRSPEAYDLFIKARLVGRSLSPRAPLQQYRDIENLLSRAIALDPSFALAYASRSTFRGVMFAWNYDTSEALVRRIREDADVALRLAPHEPYVLAAKALYWSWIEQDLPRALASFESSEMAGLADPMLLTGKSTLLVRLRRVDEAVNLNERLIALDPGNPFIRLVFAAALADARRYADALQFLNRELERFPEDGTTRFFRAPLIFYYTGRSNEWRAALDQANETMGAVTMLDQNFSLLTFERRYAELQRLLEGVSATSTRVVVGGGSGAFFGVGERPIAEYRGWTALFLKDSATAAMQGRDVLKFVANQKETRWNAWYLQLLTAEGWAFLGQQERAIAAGRKTLELMPPSRDAMSWVMGAQSIAGIYAWTGAQAEAVALLEELATVRPGLAPGRITRNPIYAIPLAQNPRYQALTRRLEEQMRETGPR
jgi:TolB-like protein